MPPGNWTNAERRACVTAIVAAVIGSAYATRRFEQDFDHFRTMNPGSPRKLEEHLAIKAWEAQAALEAAEP